MGANRSEGVTKNKKAAVIWANICAQNYGIIPNSLKITLLHFDWKFEHRLTNSKTSFVRPNGSFAVLTSPNMKNSYQCSLASLLLKKLIFDFYLPSLQLMLCSLVAVKCLPIHQP